MAKVGWLKLHRKIIEWEYFTNPECVQLLVYLLCNADEEGNIYTTVERICADLRLTRQVVRDRLKKLGSTNTSTIKSTINGTHITLCNYTSYNSGKNESQPTNQPTNQPTKKETNKEKIPPTPPIKENKKEKISSSTMCAREEFISMMKRDRTWGESVEMRYHLLPGAIVGWIDKFALDVKCREVEHRNIQDAKRHFFDWLRIQLRYEQRTSTTSKTEFLQTERERIEREIAELTNEYHSRAES